MIGRVAALIFGLAMLAAARRRGRATSAPATDPDWPCIQRKVPELSLGGIWQRGDIAVDAAAFHRPGRSDARREACGAAHRDG